MDDLDFKQKSISCNGIQQCRELIELDKKEEYLDMLEEFFEAWITNPHSDGTPAHRRANYLARYKQLRKFVNTM